MAKGVDQPKVPPEQVAERTLDGLRQGASRVLADQRAEEVRAAVSADPGAVAAEMQRAWDATRR